MHSMMVWRENLLENRVGESQFASVHWFAGIDSLGVPVKGYITVSLDHWVSSSATVRPVKDPNSISAGNLSMPSSSRLSNCGDIDLLSWPSHSVEGKRAFFSNSARRFLCLCPNLHHQQVLQASIDKHSRYLLCASTFSTLFRSGSSGGGTSV